MFTKLAFMLRIQVIKFNSLIIGIASSATLHTPQPIIHSLKIQHTVLFNNPVPCLALSLPTDHNLQLHASLHVCILFFLQILDNFPLILNNNPILPIFALQFLNNSQQILIMLLKILGLG